MRDRVNALGIAVQRRTVAWIGLCLPIAGDRRIRLIAIAAQKEVEVLDVDGLDRSEPAEFGQSGREDLGRPRRELLANRDRDMNASGRVETQLPHRRAQVDLAALGLSLNLAWPTARCEESPQGGLDLSAAAFPALFVVHARMVRAGAQRDALMRSFNRPTERRGAVWQELRIQEAQPFWRSSVQAIEQRLWRQPLQQVHVHQLTSRA